MKSDGVESHLTACGVGDPFERNRRINVRNPAIRAASVSHHDTCDPSLVLFDIDATLIVTGGVGIQAMVDAGGELFTRASTPTVSKYAGRLVTHHRRDYVPGQCCGPSPGTSPHFGTDIAGIRNATSAVALAGHLRRPRRFGNARERPALRSRLLTGNYRGNRLSCRLAASRRTSLSSEPGATNRRTPGHRGITSRRSRSIGTTSDSGDVSAAKRVTVIGDTPHDVGLCGHRVAPGRRGRDGKHRWTNCGVAGPAEPKPRRHRGPARFCCADRGRERSRGDRGGAGAIRVSAHVV